MKTFRDLNPDDIIIFKNFKVFQDCDDFINGVHYTQKVTLVDVNCVVECGTRYLQEIKSDDPVEPAWSLHRLIEILDIWYLELNFNEFNNAYDQVISYIEERVKGGFINKKYLEE